MIREPRSALPSRSAFVGALGRNRTPLRAVVVVFLLLAGQARSAEEDPIVRSLAFAPDGKRLAVGTGDPKAPGGVTLWDVATRQRVWTHAEKAGVRAVSFSPDGKTLAIATSDHGARLLDAATGKVKATLEHPNEVRAAAFAPDGRRLATGCKDKVVRVWDLATSTEVVRCVGHQNPIYAVEFSADGKLLLSVGGEDGAILWDAATGAVKRTLLPSSFLMSSGGFSADGRWVITGSYDGTTRIWNSASGAPRAILGGIGGVQQLAVSRPARAVAVCGFGRDISLFEVNLSEPTDKELERIRALLTQLDDDSYDVRETTGKKLLEIGFVAEAELLRAAREGASVEVRIRARRLRQEMLSRPRATLRGHTDEVLAVAFSPDAKLLASGGRDGTVRLWDLTSQKEVAHFVPGR
jgi:WD40 repeat protein